MSRSSSGIDRREFAQEHILFLPSDHLLKQRASHPRPNCRPLRTESRISCSEIVRGCGIGDCSTKKLWARCVFLLSPASVRPQTDWAALLQGAIHSERVEFARDFVEARSKAGKPWHCPAEPNFGRPPKSSRRCSGAPCRACNRATRRPEALISALLTNVQLSSFWENNR